MADIAYHLRRNPLFHGIRDSAHKFTHPVLHSHVQAQQILRRANHTEIANIWIIMGYRQTHTTAI